MCVLRVLRMFLHATVACGTELLDLGRQQLTRAPNLPLPEENISSDDDSF